MLPQIPPSTGQRQRGQALSQKSQSEHYPTFAVSVFAKSFPDIELSAGSKARIVHMIGLKQYPITTDVGLTCLKCPSFSSQLGLWDLRHNWLTACPGGAGSRRRSRRGGLPSCPNRRRRPRCPDGRR